MLSARKLARRWVVAVVAMSSLAVLVAPATALADSITYGANFSVNDVDPWGPGAQGAVNSASQLYSVSWNASDESRDYEDWAGMTFGGKIGGASNGNLGVTFGYNTQDGALDINYPASVEVNYPTDETYFPGDTVRVSTVDHSAAGTFTFDQGPQDMYIDTHLAFHADAGGEICFFSCSGTFPFFPDINIPQENLRIIGQHVNAGQYGTIYESNAVTEAATNVSGTISSPQPDSSLDIATPARMYAETTGEFVNMTLDVDGFSKYPWGKSVSVPDTDIAVSYDVIDGKIFFTADQRHTFDFRPAVHVDFALPRVMAHRVVHANGTTSAWETSAAISLLAGESFDLTLPTDQTQPFALTPTISLPSTMHHTLDQTYQIRGNVLILKASANLPSAEVTPSFNPCGWFGEDCTVPALRFPGLSFGFGPVFEQPIPIGTTRPDLFDRTWSVAFAPQAKPSRSFDPENVPVADAGGPYAFDEGTGGDLDGTASYDFDSDDVLTYEWSLDSPGSLEASGDTPRFDALDGDHTYTATLRVCDLKHNCSTDTAQVQVRNVAPTHVLDTSTAIAFGNGAGFLARIGVADIHSATATDTGTDDTTYGWSAGPYATWTPPSSTYFNNGASADAHPSAFGTLPFASSSSSSVVFSQPGVFTLRLVVSDDDGGSTTTTIPVLLADSSGTQRPYGWFKQQYSLQGNRVLTPTQLDAYLAFTRMGSAYFSEVVVLDNATQAYAVLQKLDTTTATQTEQTRAFLLTAWLNVASGAVRYDGALAKRMQQPGRTKVSDALHEVEATLKNPAATKAQLVSAMQVAQAVGSV